FVPHVGRRREARLGLGRGLPLGRGGAVGHLCIWRRHGDLRGGRAFPVESDRQDLSFRPRRRSTAATFASSWPVTPLRSSILMIVETRWQFFITALWQRAMRARTSSNDPSMTVPIGFTRYGRPLRSTMSTARATCSPTLTPLPIGVILNSAMVIARPRHPH